ncbi:MAG TPA: DinB family protein [Gemmatimonadaceae bacterium]|nr:DinB family protein [Gemmatimonadaceae bacterium]
MRTVAPARWFSREFAFDLDLSAYPNVVERVRGTPARLEERVRGLNPTTLTTRVGDRWSIQENVGHLLDLEALWLGRLDDFEAGAERLRAADLMNRATDDADHNSADLSELLARFRRQRATFVARLDAYDEAFIARAALHPRLTQSMRVLDHVLFVAEHDDHHLATITALIGELNATR